MLCALLLGSAVLSSVVVRLSELRGRAAAASSEVPPSAPSAGGLLRCPRLGRDLPVPEFYARPPCFHELADAVSFYHLGKAGGGTVRRRLELLRLRVHRFHPFPRHPLKGTTEVLFATVRDPVDRFVSAFNWRAAVLCGGPDDPRMTHAGDPYLVSVLDYACLPLLH